jgi:hypothetical protein
MEIVRKIAAKAADLHGAKIPTIAFLGDSVTQGCFECYRKNNGGIETIFDKDHAYHHYVDRIFTLLYPRVPLNIINAGISGDDTAGGLERLERDVLVHKPDLTVVCFGLNDSCKEFEGVERYKQRLQAIFTKLQESGSEVIFMTANMMNTSVSCHLQGDYFRDFAVKFMERQNAGVLTAYFEGGKEVAKACGVKICDVYSKWMKLYENGVDVTELLANKLNHPVREMNWVFAYELVNTMMND